VAPAPDRLVFDVLHATPEATLLGLPPRLLDTDVMHVRARSDSGVIGRSVLSRAAGVTAEGVELGTLAFNNWRNGTRPSGALTTDGSRDEQQRTRIKARMDAYRGSENTGKLLVLEGGLKFDAFSLSSADAELLESRRFSVSDICRIFLVPEILLQIGTTAPTTLTPYLAAFAQMALAPLVASLEAEFDEAALPSGYHLQLDMAGLLRGDYAAIAAANAVLVQSGIATANDARRALGLPAHDDGDTLRAGPAPTFPADSSGVPSLAPKPGPGGGPLPNTGTHENDGAG
jgi:HK97 family phage portal protein